jgi:hypothetical protein
MYLLGLLVSSFCDPTNAFCALVFVLLTATRVRSLLDEKTNVDELKNR